MKPSNTQLEIEKSLGLPKLEELFHATDNDPQLHEKVRTIILELRELSKLLSESYHAVKFL